MNIIRQSIEGVLLIKPDIFEDERGTFRRNFCAEEMKKNGVHFTVCQGNISENKHKFTMRGFHYQKYPSKEPKILTPIDGKIYNVLIDLRMNSPTFLKSINLEISSERKESLHIPPGCANAFLTLEDWTVIQYYMGDYFRQESYSGFRYNDPFFNVNWPYPVSIISEKDNSFKNFSIDNL
jgi:dTDP-4-dehydrorhamnose 3,5-epimerase